MDHQKEQEIASPLTIELLPQDFSVCKVKDYSQTEIEGPFCFTGATDEEKSLVCETGSVPGNATEREDGWRAFRIRGTLDFSLIGILAKISTLLAQQVIGTFAVSTYNTDYIFTKAGQFESAVDALENAGYRIVR